MKPLLVLTTTSSLKSANRLASRLVKERLAACVTVQPRVTSHYIWKRKQSASSEAMLWIKTDRKRLKDLRIFFLKNHSYEIPELLAVPVADGSPQYLAWMDKALSTRRA